MIADVIIPARGGSKGVPLKNLAKIGGRSLIARAVDAALRAEGVRHVWVSTDSPEIAAEAADAGAEAIARPSSLSRDDSTSEDTIKHALRQIGQPIDAVAMVQCTTVMLAPEDIEGCLRALETSSAPSAVSVAPFHGCVWREDGMRLAPVNHSPWHRFMRQDRADQWVETGGVYAFRVEPFLATGSRFCQQPPIGVPAKHPMWLEVDEPEDMRMARALLEDRHGL